MTEFKYCVYSNDNHNFTCFKSEAEAMSFAREQAKKYNVRVEKTLMDMDSEWGYPIDLDSEVIWQSDKLGIEESEENLVKENPFDNDFPESDIVNINEIDDIDYEKIARQYEEDPSDWIDDNKLMKEAVEALEENESEVECKCCFELFPKEACVKTDKGYICQKCNQELHSHQGTNLDLVDADPFDLDYDDPRDPEKEDEPEVKEELFDANENRKHKEGIEEDLTLKINKDEIVVNDGEEDIAIIPTPEADEIKVENEAEAPIEDPIVTDELIAAEDEPDWTDEDEAIIESLKEENLEEHINDRPADIESDQELQGADNAVIPCEVAKVVAHSEDEKPLDCKMEKAPLEKPLASEEVEVKVNEELVEENLEEAKKDEDELPPDPSAVKVEVHSMLNNLVADEIEAIDGYETAKQEIIDAPIEHKDELLDTVDHITDEEKEHIDELIDAASEIPFDKEEAPVVEEPVVEPEPEVIPEEPVVEEELNEDPFGQDFPKNEEKPLVEVAAPLPFDSDVKVGDKIRIGRLEGEDHSYDGKEGEVTHIDDIGQLHGTWGGLAVIPGVDDFEVITNENLNEELSDDQYTKVEEWLKDLEAKLRWLELDWEGEYDYYGVTVEYDKDKDDYAAYISVYHASEDNNAENVEAHTDEEEYHYNSLKELHDNLVNELGDEFGKYFEAEVNNKKLLEASSAEKKAFKQGGEAYDDLIAGTAIGMIKDPKARAAAVAALKAGRKDLLKAYIGDRHEDAAIDILTKKQTAMANAGMTDESLNEDFEEDEVECGWCGEEYPESDCRYEKDFGWLCPQCEAGLKSRGEELIFIEPAPEKE